MDRNDISYLLKRARFHRGMARMTKCSEARCVHHQLVENYQTRLLAIRRARSPSFQVNPELVEA